jgi:exopolysaccharide biosynthesis protein
MKLKYTLLLLFFYANATTFAAPPESKWNKLFQGVDGSELKTKAPRLMVGYAVKIDLKTDGVSFLATPKANDPTKPKAETLGLKTSTFLDKYQCQVAINAAPYGPIHPHENDTQDISGLHVSRGQMVSEAWKDYPALLISKSNKTWIQDPPYDLKEVENAVGGFQIVLKDSLALEGKTDLHPRTGAGISADGKTMIWLVIDGRQKDYSDGATTKDVGEWLKSLGCASGINLDGGGTTTLVVSDPDGKPKVMNRPIHGNKPGQERVSASHLGLFAKPKP